MGQMVDSSEIVLRALIQNVLLPHFDRVIVASLLDLLFPLAGECLRREQADFVIHALIVPSALHTPDCHVVCFVVHETIIGTGWSDSGVMVDTLPTDPRQPRFSIVDVNWECMIAAAECYIASGIRPIKVSSSYRSLISSIISSSLQSLYAFIRYSCTIVARQSVSMPSIMRLA